MAERGGFEPPVRFKPVRRFSKPFLSATQASLRIQFVKACGKLQPKSEISSQKVNFLRFFCLFFDFIKKIWVP